MGIFDWNKQPKATVKILMIKKNIYFGFATLIFLESGKIKS